MNLKAKNIYEDKVNTEFKNITTLIANNEVKENWKPDLSVRVDMLEASVYNNADHLNNALAKRLDELKAEAEKEADEQ